MNCLTTTRIVFYFLFLSFTLCYLSAGAQVFDLKLQDVDLGIRGGLSVPSLGSGGSSSTPLNTGFSSRFGPDAAIFADLKFSDLFLLQPGFEFSSQGGKKDGVQAFPTPTQIAFFYPAGTAPPYLYANFNNTVKLNYLMLPILAKFSWDLKSSPFRFYAAGGPFFGYLLYANQSTNGTSTIYSDSKGLEPLSSLLPQESFASNTDLKNQLHKLNFGAEANIGLLYKFNRSSCFVEVGGNYGLLNIQKEAANGKNNTGAATISIGYSYSLFNSK